MVWGLFSFGAVASAAKLDDKNMIMTQVWYQPALFSSLEEAAGVVYSLQQSFCDWSGRDIQQVQLDRVGIRIYAVHTWTESGTQYVPTNGGIWTKGHYTPIYGGVYQTTQTPHSDESRIFISATNVAKIELWSFPNLERDNKWGVDIKFIDGANITLRTRDLDTAKKLADAVATLTAANDRKLPASTGLVAQIVDLPGQFARLKWTQGTGILVCAVMNGSPADMAGLMSDDIVFAVNGQAIADPRSFKDMIDNALGNNPQVTFDLQVFRNGQEIAKQLTVKNPNYGAAKLSAGPKAMTSGPAPQRLGVSARNLTAEEAQKAGLANTAGVYIISVDAGSLAEQMGLKAGDYLLELNGKQLADVSALQQALSADIISVVKVWREGNIISLNGINKL